MTLKMALAAASDRLTAHLPINPEWGDLVEAAYKLRQELGISQASWAQACQLMGRNGAALCLLITDQAALRKTNPVHKPAAYFHRMQARAEAGELHLHASIFGLLRKQRLLVA